MSVKHFKTIFSCTIGVDHKHASYLIALLIVKDPSEITKETQGSRNTVLSGNSSIDQPKTPYSNAREKKSTSDGKKSRSGILSRH